MRRRTFMGFVAWCVAVLPVGSSFVAAADGIRVSGPMVHDNLAIYFLHGSATGGAIPISLEEALANGRVKVRETGNVNELTMENVGDSEVFVQAGDIVKGGRQNRVLSVDLLLPPRSGVIPIAAFCVEAGRWTARGQEDGRQFSTAAAAMPSHDAKVAMRTYMASAGMANAAKPSPAAGQPYAADPSRADTGSSQQKIWATVKATQDRLARSVGASVAAPASPSSLQLSLESEKLKAAQSAYLTALQNGEVDNDVVGYIAAINGKITSGDAYASPELFRKMWPKLLAASVTEAIGTKDAASADPPSAEQLAAFMKAVESAPEAERAVNNSVRLVTRDGDGSLYAETRRADGGWVHRNYLAK
jgi:hypothetical protein